MLPWYKNIFIKKKMILRSRHIPDTLLISISGEYEDTREWQKQTQYWQKKCGYELAGRRTLVKCQHIAFMNGDIVYMSPGDKVYVFPREQISPLNYDEVDRLLGCEA